MMRTSQEGCLQPSRSAVESGNWSTKLLSAVYNLSRKQKVLFAVSTQWSDHKLFSQGLVSSQANLYEQLCYNLLYFITVQLHWTIQKQWLCLLFTATNKLDVFFSSPSPKTALTLQSSWAFCFLFHGSVSVTCLWLGQNANTYMQNANYIQLLNYIVHCWRPCCDSFVFSDDVHYTVDMLVCLCVCVCVCVGMYWSICIQFPC